MRLKFFAKNTPLFFVLLFLLVTLSCISNPEIINQDTGTDIGTDTDTDVSDTGADVSDTDTGTDIGSAPYELLGEKYSNISREIIKKYGSPQTLSGTNNERWVAYFPKGDFTIITDARTTTIKAVLSGREDDLERILQY
jgi:hypothetical protein